MRVLLIHQNLPGQNKHLGPALVERGDTVVALTPKVEKHTHWQGINIISYKISRGTSKDVHPWLLDLEAKIICAEAGYDVAVKMKAHGLTRCVLGSS